MENLTNNEIEIVRDCLWSEVLELEQYIRKNCLDLADSEIEQLQETIDSNRLIMGKLAR